MIALAWILAVLGFAVAFVVSLAGAMSTVPQLAWRDALVAVPLPALAALLAAFRLARPPRDRQQRAWIAAGLPLGLAIFTLLFMAQSYFGQPGGPR